MTLEAELSQMFAAYPSLFHNNKLRAFNQLFVVNGNGRDWVHGELIRNYVDSSDMKVVAVDWHRLFSSVGTVGGIHDPLFILPSVIRPISFYQLDLENYSALGHIPKNVADDWLEGAALALLWILHFRRSPYRLSLLAPNAPRGYVSEEDNYPPQDNHTNALILLNRYSAMFKRRSVWADTLNDLEVLAPYYKGAKFWEIRERRQAYLIKLGYRISKEEYLTDDEFLDFHEVSTLGFDAYKDKIRLIVTADLDRRMNLLSKKEAATRKE